MNLKCLLNMYNHEHVDNSSVGIGYPPYILETEIFKWYMHKEYGNQIKQIKKIIKIKCWF